MTTSTSQARKYTAIIIAGKRPGIDPVAAAYNQTYKALAPVGGRAMVARVLEAISATPTIAQITLVTDDAIGPVDDIPGVSAARSHVPINRVRAEKTISASVSAAIAAHPDETRFLIATADHPLLTPEIVSYFIDHSKDKPGVCVALVERNIIEATYPDMQRTYLKFRGAEVSGANLFAINDRSGLNAVRFWENVEANRKKPWKLAASFGLVNLIGFACRLYSIDTAFRRTARQLECEAHPILLPHADAAVDVDKLTDVKTVEAILAAR